jgi:hypothetical protein
MKKIIGILLAVLLSLALPLSVVAAELTGCTVMAESAAGAPGEEVTVEVRIGDNPGFTNFAIALDYDREHLTLKSINTTDGNTPYLCGSNVSINEVWDEEEKEYGFVVSASADAVKENGVLFTVTFEIAADFIGEAEVTPLVQYIRNNEAVFSIFEQIHAAVSTGIVTSVLVGDVNGDGIIEYNDVMLAYKAFVGEAELTQEQMAVVDTNRNGTIEEAEYQAVYQVYIGG